MHFHAPQTLRFFTKLHKYEFELLNQRPHILEAGLLYTCLTLVLFFTSFESLVIIELVQKLPTNLVIVWTGKSRVLGDCFGNKKGNRIYFYVRGKVGSGSTRLFFEKSHYPKLVHS